MAFDAFISYASPDKPVADAVCARLESAGIRCWIAPRDITPGLSYGEAIITAIHSARVMILVFSSHANKSPQVPKEIERAVSRSVPIIPFRIEDVTPGVSLDYFIGSVHWLDALTPPLEQHLDSLVATVRKLVPAREEIDATRTMPFIRPTPQQNAAAPAAPQPVAIPQSAPAYPPQPSPPPQTMPPQYAPPYVPPPPASSGPSFSLQAGSKGCMLAVALVLVLCVSMPLYFLRRTASRPSPSAGVGESASTATPASPVSSEAPASSDDSAPLDQSASTPASTGVQPPPSKHPGTKHPPASHPDLDTSAGSVSVPAPASAEDSQPAAAASNAPANAGMPAAPRIKMSPIASAAQIIYKVNPTYPEQARLQHVQGRVVLHVIIGKDGTVLIADPVSGPNELVDAAVATVKQWRYKTTLSDGQPVEVETQVSINYTLH